ncbi:hypothetical protein DL96DRAFT_1597182, partial [Flagelloscypha sp. PMI_526]
TWHIHFDTDEAYQQGLASILTQNSLNEDGLRQTRVFYFNRYPRFVAICASSNRVL